MSRSLYQKALSIWQENMNFYCYNMFVRKIKMNLYRLPNIFVQFTHKNCHVIMKCLLTLVNYFSSLTVFFPLSKRLQSNSWRTHTSCWKYFIRSFIFEIIQSGKKWVIARIFLPTLCHRLVSLKTKNMKIERFQFVHKNSHSFRSSALCFRKTRIQQMGSKSKTKWKRRWYEIGTQIL